MPVTVSTLFETGVGLAGALHLAATAPGLQAHGLATAELLESDLLQTPLAIASGRMTVPGGSGLGVDLDHDAIARYRAAMTRLTPDPLLERVARDPEALALTARSATWTRGQLLSAADGLATAIAGEGLTEGDRLACLLADDAPMVALIHAARRLGAVLVPLNRRGTPRPSCDPSSRRLERAR